MSIKSEQLCRFYSRGKKCRFGDTCRFQHIETDLSSENTFADKQSYIPLKESSELDSYSGEAITDKSITTSNYEGLNSRESKYNPTPESSKTSTLDKQRKVCSYFSQHRRCAFGRHCRFLHEHSDKLDAVKSVVDSSSETSADPTCRYDSQVVEDNQVITLSPHPDAEDEKKESKICNYFARNGHCPYKRRCRFKHVKRSDGYVKPQEHLAQAKNDERTEQEGNAVLQKSQQFETKSAKPKVKQRLCRFYQNGHCKSGDRCRFWHPMDVIEDLTDDFEETAIKDQSDSKSVPSDVSEDTSLKLQSTEGKNPPQAPASHQSRVVLRPASQKISLNRETASREEIEKLRMIEINQLQKRFPRDRCNVVKDESDVFECRVKFTPSDPDWPFDVKMFELLFTIPSTYPQEMLTISLPVDQDLPETVRRYIELCVADWVVEKGDQLEEAGVYEIVFRPFLRWLDRSLESNVTEALRQMKRELVAKAAGFEFITAAELQSKYKASEGKPDSDKEESGEDMKESDRTDDCSNEDEDEDADNQAHQLANRDMETEKKGTEVSLKYLQLREGAATLLFEKIRIVIQCSRCKNHTDFSTPPRRVNAIACSKCNNSQMLTFRPVLVHHFSSVIGYLDLDNCTAHDLVLQESVAQVGCMGCSKESKLDGISPGQPLNTWCRHCHMKMMVATESVRFAQLQPSGIETDQQKVHQIATKKRVQKDPAIQEGKPLPQYGACKHYKKSYRWFRFPCCGMVYPCDLCHEEKSDGHEMVFANRVVCGFCCKEQPYSPDKPCTMCQQMLTRAKSSHWEGGFGCRNKVKMSKSDSQKYSSMNKTISKHAQKLKENNSKKRTKLRHA